MFNLSGSEIVVILLLALVVLGPEKLPDALKRAGRTYAELKKMGNSFQEEVKSALDEPMKEMRDTADLLAKMAGGIADDLATTLLLATDKKVVVAPAMNVRMWQHPATERNVAQLKVDGVTVIDPDEGEMACGEYGPGRLPEPQAIVDFLAKNGFLGAK